MHQQVSSVIFTIALSTTAAAASAQSRFDEEFDDKDKPWTEIAVQMPSPPTAENLLPFYVSATATQTFAIDAKSLSLGSDGVIRYTLVSKSAEGATNISYEGIRCQSFEKKLYAFGRPDGTWSRSRRDQWERITLNAANRQHAALAKDYFCQEKTVAGKVGDMVDRLRNQRPLSPS
ncbi:hypothetical protein D3870_02765 [Noviherbaspirillum cavernae]|uniref:CNP1-like uncharacterized domain-containing protein n=1 Tax=Noviherbaspirillum cavernae TaxID=2320862 RepID=A0A418X5Z9_9BURK|nr:CNP1-like family protein [Noviherbaspirillum cavernae]RJG07791.1 hypothetical protein D3870_02765 [Noviherbaspirillum cavernae]